MKKWDILDNWLGKNTEMEMSEPFQTTSSTITFFNPKYLQGYQPYTHTTQTDEILNKPLSSISPMSSVNIKGKNTKTERRWEENQLWELSLTDTDQQKATEKPNQDGRQENKRDKQKKSEQEMH